MNEPRYDVIAIGNAIVDVMAPCADELIEELQLNRGDPGDLDVVAGQQAAEHQAELVGGVAGVGLHPPRVHDLVALEGGQHRVGVTDVDTEQHPTSTSALGGPRRCPR